VYDTEIIRTSQWCSLDGEPPRLDSEQIATGEDESAPPTVRAHSLTADRANESTRANLHGSLILDSGKKDRTYFHLRAQTRLGTWNVRSLYQPGKKLKIVEDECRRCRMQILGPAEIRWTRKGHFHTDEHMIFYSGSEAQHEYGVALRLDWAVSKSVMDTIL